MTRSSRSPGPSRHAAFVSTCLLALALGGCGGGGGGSSSTTPPSVPAPTPAPPPPPPPASGFNDAEFTASIWNVVNMALPAFEAGATGRGVTIAVIDSGVRSTDPEFAGRVTVLGPPAGQDGHGTTVAAIAAGARNGSGTMGVTFEATILSYNTMRCSPDCFHSLDDVAAAVDDAVRRGARVINLSLVGPASREPLLSALIRATQAGVIVVIAAGNTGGAGPEGFALENATTTNSRLLIIVGGHDTNGQLSPGSSRAGTGAQWYLAAYGGATSFSTPVVSGAAALLAASFPGLSGHQIATILLETAIDAGAPGVDPVYGNGVLNIGRAYERARQVANGN